MVIVADKPAEDRRGSICPVLTVAAQASFVSGGDLGFDV
jgi:hypothetical protein